MVQWLRLCTSNAGSAGSIPDWGTKIPHAAWQGCKQIKQKNRFFKKFLEEVLLVVFIFTESGTTICRCSKQ